MDGTFHTVTLEALGLEEEEDEQTKTLNVHI